MKIFREYSQCQGLLLPQPPAERVFRQPDKIAVLLNKTAGC